MLGEGLEEPGIEYEGIYIVIVHDRLARPRAAKGTILPIVLYLASRPQRAERGHGVTLLVVVLPCPRNNLAGVELSLRDELSRQLWPHQARDDLRGHRRGPLMLPLLDPNAS